VIDDFRDFLRELVQAKVKFLVVGAHALSVHGVPRATGDLDVLIQADPANAERVMEALVNFGAPIDSLGIRASDFARPDVVAQFGLPPYRIDVLTAISGVSFEEAWRDHVVAEIEGVGVPIIGRRAFIHNKRSTGRAKDLTDIESLGES
jgi:hypothetical protein